MSKQANKQKNEGKEKSSFFRGKCYKDPLFYLMLILGTVTPYLIITTNIPTDEKAIQCVQWFLSATIIIALIFTISLLRENNYFSINAWFILIFSLISGIFSLYLWYALLWLPYEQKRPEVFSGLMSALAFVGLIITILVQVYHHRKGQEMELKKMRGEYIANHKRHTEIREEVLRKMREASNQGKYIEEIFSKRDEHYARVTIRTFEEELGLRNSSQIRSERKIS